MSRFEHLEIGDSTLPITDNPENQGDVSINNYLTKANEAFNREDYEHALAYYSRVLQYDVNQEAAWLGQIRCMVEMGSLNDAITWSDRATQRFPNSAPILAVRGTVASRADQPVTALRCSDLAITMNNVDSFVWIARGEILVPVNELNAESCFVKAVEISPDDWSIRFDIGKAYAIHNRYHQALQHLKSACSIDSKHPACWYWIGRCHEELGEIEEAKLAYERSLACDPRFEKAATALEELKGIGFLSRIGRHIKGLLGESDVA